MKSNRAAIAKIDIRIARRAALLTDRLLTKHSGKVNRVAGPNEDSCAPICFHDRFCRGRTTRAKRAESYSGRCRSGEADADFTRSTRRLDCGKTGGRKRGRWRIQNHERPPRL